MSSLFETFVAQEIAKGFQGKLLSGTLRRYSATSVDDSGNPIYSNPVNYAVQGIREDFTTFFATFNGIPNTDIKIMLIVNLTTPFTIPLKDDLIYIRSQWHQVRKQLEMDPASATINLQCFEIVPPA